MPTKSFKELLVWQKAKILAVEIYKLTENYPKSEQYGITNQMRRAAVSISSNIAESYNRFHSKEKKQFIYIAYGSGSELESQIEISKELFPKLNYKESEKIIDEVMRMLNKILNSSF